MQNAINKAIKSTATKAVKAKPSKKAANVPAAEPVAIQPIETVAAEAITEAEAIDPRVLKAEKLAADRTAVANFYAKLSDSVSVPVKAVSAFKLAHVTAHPIARKPSQRQAAAIVTAFAASGIELADGASAPRVFEINEIRSSIENGALRDAISANLITITGDTPETSFIKLRNKAAAAITGLLGAKAVNAAYGK